MKQRQKTIKGKMVNSILNKKMISFIAISSFVTLSLSLYIEGDIKNNNTDNNVEQENSVNVYNSIGIENTTEIEKMGNVSMYKNYQNEATLPVGKTYVDFNDKFTLGLVEIIKNKNAIINFNLNSRFGNVTVGEDTIFIINNQKYRLVVTEINGVNEYIKFKILPI